MTIWDKFKFLLKANTIFEEAKGEAKMGKSIFKSKTFWANLIGLGIQLAGFVDPKYGVPGMAILNIFLRVLTDQPVTIPGVSGN